MTTVERDNETAVKEFTDADRQAIIEDLTSDAAAPEPKKTTEARSYVVLRKAKGSSPSAPLLWEFVGDIEATSSEQAIRKTVEANPAADTVTFVAVPARSFVPVSVTTKTVTTVVLS